MNVSKVSMAQPLSFHAKTTINAPESLLSKEDKAYFENIGSKLGTNKDTIEISIGELEQSECEPDVTGYRCNKVIKQKTSKSASTNQSSIFVPYIVDGKVNEKTSPKNYLQRIFNRMSQNF